MRNKEAWSGRSKDPGDLPQWSQVLPADSLGYHSCPVVCARFEPTTTFSYTTIMLTRDSLQNQDEITTFERTYYTTRDSTNDKAIIVRDTSNM